MPIRANVIQQAFSPLITVFEAIMVFIHDHIVGGSWGLAIIGLTVLIRAVLVPLTFRQLKSMQEMQRLAPQITALKEKYKEDKQRQQQELMKFYQENKINPLASCLPLLMQLPVFISLFYMLRTDLKKHICGPALEAHYRTEASAPLKLIGPLELPGGLSLLAFHNRDAVVKGLEEFPESDRPPVNVIRPAFLVMVTAGFLSAFVAGWAFFAWRRNFPKSIRSGWTRCALRRSII